MKKLILLMLMIPFVYGYELNNGDYKMSVGIVSGQNLSNDNYKLDANIYGIQSEISNSDYKMNFGYLTNWVISTVTPGDEEVGGGGGGGGAVYEYQSKSISISTPYYDVVIENVNPKYDVEDIIYPKIIIINKGDVPDRDAILTYHLLSPLDTKYGEAREVFEEVPPTCPNATYDRYQDICVNDEGTFEPYKTVLEREIALPLKSPEGEWQFHVSYETEVQPTINVYKSFRVGAVDTNLMMILGILLGIYVFNTGKEVVKKKVTKKNIDKILYSKQVNSR